jgi:hypothetical protein
LDYPYKEIPAIPPGGPVAAEVESVLLDSLRAGRGVTLIALGNSMMPLLRAGSVVRVEPAHAASVGEVVAIERPDGGLALHRVVAHVGALVVTWGDALRAPDAWGPSVVLGRVISPAVALSSVRSWRGWRAHLHIALGPRETLLSLLSWARASR